MKTAMNIANHQIRLFGTLDFDEVLKAVYGVCDELWSPPAMGLLIYDSDLEVFSDTLFFGPKGAALEPLTELFAGTLERELDLTAPMQGVIDLPGASDKVPPELAPLYFIRVQEGDTLTAIIILGGIGQHEPVELQEELKPYSLFLALTNAWEIRELKRENERLRSRYDDLELTNSNLEEQTRKLIHDVEVKDALRYRRMEKEKVLFEISSAVRSSLEIQQVLQMACENLGKRPFEVSRALILRLIGANADLMVYEHHDGQTTPVRELFFSEAGRKFVEVVLTKTAPCEVSELEDAVMSGFDPDFLKGFGFLSGLIIPIMMREKTIGAIFLQDCKFPRQTWSIDDLTYFGALADQLSVAIENADLHEEKKQQAVTDGLTGISNRRNFNEIFAKEFERAKRYAEPLSLAVFDLDYLKKINDTYGHSAGDDAIKTIARVLSNSSRSIDLPARYGGEEFCLLLPNTLLEESVLIAERIRKLINEVELAGPGKISASIGVANFPLHASDPDELFERADEALYAAKQGGRNRVCVYDVPEGNPETVAK